MDTALSKKGFGWLWRGKVERTPEQEVPLAEITTQSGFEILAVEVMPDHVHLSVSAPPKFSPAEIVRLFKGIPSRKLKKEFESLRRQYWGELGMYAAATLWAEGDYGGTAGHVSAETSQPSIAESQQKSLPALKL